MPRRWARRSTRPCGPRGSVAAAEDVNRRCGRGRQPAMMLIGGGGCCLQVPVVTGRCLSRSVSGPRPTRCTKLAPWRSRRLVGEVLSRASARWAACSIAKAATSAATVGSGHGARRLVGPVGASGEDIGTSSSPIVGSGLGRPR
jgi:hypothetical protein